MDISEIKTSERTLEIKHPKTGAELGISVSLIALDDDRMKKIKRQIQDKKLYLEARNKHFKAEEIEENRNLVSYSALTGWTWRELKDVDGKVVAEQPLFRGVVPEFSRKTVYEVFNELPWFRDQIDEALGDEKSFF